MPMIKISASILAADFTRLGEEVRDVLDGGADYIHVDVMDGIFVPNITMGLPVLESLRAAFPKVFFDVHLMITEPERFVDAFCGAGADLLTFHVEADTQEGISRALEKAMARGVKTGIALRPGTPAEDLLPWLDRIDMALVMMVEPGFGGQPFRSDLLSKLRQVRALLEENSADCDLEVDGGVSADTAHLVVEAGANVLVTGSSLFGQKDRHATLKILRNG